MSFRLVFVGVSYVAQGAGALVDLGQCGLDWKASITPQNVVFSNVLGRELASMDPRITNNQLVRI
jgi:hypothetical protein